ncbi:hypothetical protein LTR78_010903 [Recurvomyces mirabilis]|uniref:Uncharacterized protein n=2 Tax=Recurvomyces mirabilis TaxID=574656 RepID=A0AAE0TNZ5_9PEZI|nr:hypothetical protein LTR78_010903 [Recurvomyces mirabilis]
MAAIKGQSPVVCGPLVLFHRSLIVEFLEPDDTTPNSTVVIKVTFKGQHANTKLGKAHPAASLDLPWRAPPLHLHFEQSESFVMLSGRLGNTMGWDAKDRVFTPADGVNEIPPWLPHNFWPDPTCTDEDTVVVLWAHPEATPSPMQINFFESLFLLLSEKYEAGQTPDFLQLCLSQQEVATAGVIFPTAWWLGPLRWGVPWIMQSSMAQVARWCGYKVFPFESSKSV